MASLFASLKSFRDFSEELSRENEMELSFKNYTQITVYVDSDMSPRSVDCR